MKCPKCKLKIKTSEKELQQLIKKSRGTPDYYVFTCPKCETLIGHADKIKGGA